MQGAVEDSHESSDSEEDFNEEDWVALGVQYRRLLTHSGALVKRGAKRKNWKKRWFHFASDTADSAESGSNMRPGLLKLYYSDLADADKPSRAINYIALPANQSKLLRWDSRVEERPVMANGQVLAVQPPKEFPLCIVLSTLGRTYFLCTDSEDDYYTWCSVLTRLLFIAGLRKRAWSQAKRLGWRSRPASGVVASDDDDAQQRTAMAAAISNVDLKVAKILGVQLTEEKRESLFLQRSKGCADLIILEAEGLPARYYQKTLSLKVACWNPATHLFTWWEFNHDATSAVSVDSSGYAAWKDQNYSMEYSLPGTAFIVRLVDKSDCIVAEARIVPAQLTAESSSSESSEDSAGNGRHGEVKAHHTAAKGEQERANCQQQHLAPSSPPSSPGAKASKRASKQRKRAVLKGEDGGDACWDLWVDLKAPQWEESDALRAGGEPLDQDRTAQSNGGSGGDAAAVEAKSPLSIRKNRSRKNSAADMLPPFRGRLHVSLDINRSEHNGALSTLGVLAEPLPLRLATGDVLLFDQSTGAAKMTKLLTWSRWSHAAMVYLDRSAPLVDEVGLSAAAVAMTEAAKDNDVLKRGACKVMVLEATGDGVRCERIDALWRRNHTIANIGVVKLRGLTMTVESTEALYDYIEALKGRPYERSLFSLAVKALRSGRKESGSGGGGGEESGTAESPDMREMRGSQKNKVRKMLGLRGSAGGGNARVSHNSMTEVFCSELIAGAYKAMGVLPVNSTVNFLPKHFDVGEAADSAVPLASRGYKLQPPRVLVKNPTADF